MNLEMKVSVIIPTYNAEGVIGRAIRSVFLQGMFDLEVMVVDDCSTDDTATIAENMGAKVIRNREHSGGPNKGRNTGLMWAAGDVICFLDQDDEWLEGKIQSQMALLWYAPIVFCGYKESGKQIGAGAYRLYEKNEIFIHKLRSEWDHCPYMSTIMIKKSLKDIHFEEKWGMADYDWILLLTKNQPAASSGGPYVIRHITGSNLSLEKDYRSVAHGFALETLKGYKWDYKKDVRYGKWRIRRTQILKWCAMGLSEMSVEDIHNV